VSDVWKRSSELPSSSRTTKTTWLTPPPERVSFAK
jgi:hypothetical protein